MSEKEERPSKSTGAPSRPTSPLPPRPSGEMFSNGGVGFSPGPMTLVSSTFSDSHFSDSHECKSFSQLLADAIASDYKRVGSSGEVNNSSSGDIDPRFKQNRPNSLMISQSPSMFTVPPGLSPAMLLDSPSFLDLISPVQVPHVNRTDYRLIDISEDGYVSLLTDNGSTKDDLKLPTDETLLQQIKSGFEDGKDLVVSVMSAMGEEQINAIKDIGSK